MFRSGVGFAFAILGGLATQVMKLPDWIGEFKHTKEMADGQVHLIEILILNEPIALGQQTPCQKKKNTHHHQAFGRPENQQVQVIPSLRAVRQPLRTGRWKGGPLGGSAVGFEASRRQVSHGIVLLKYDYDSDYDIYIYISWYSYHIYIYYIY